MRGCHKIPGRRRPQRSSRGAGCVGARRSARRICAAAAALPASAVVPRIVMQPGERMRSPGPLHASSDRRTSWSAACRRWCSSRAWPSRSTTRACSSASATSGARGGSRLAHRNTLDPSRAVARGVEGRVLGKQQRRRRRPAVDATAPRTLGWQAHATKLHGAQHPYPAPHPPSLPPPPPYPLNAQRGQAGGQHPQLHGARRQPEAH